MTARQMAALHALCFSVPRPWTAQEFEAYAKDPKACIVAQPGGLAVGRVVATEAELLTIAVAPDQQGQGLGRELIRTLFARLITMGAQEIFLEVAANNAPARALYASAGFQQVGVRPAYYAGIDALTLRHALDG